MSLLQTILFFLPLCWVICLVSSVLRRESLAEAAKVGTTLFVKMSLAIFAICVATYFVMEWRLSY